MWIWLERYAARSLALLIYFSGFPLLTSAIFAFAALNAIEGLILLITAVGMFASASIILETFFGRGAIRILAIGSSVPLVLFLLFNLSVTAVYAHAVYAALREEVDQLFFRDVAAQVFTGYERIVPKLWVTAMLYASSSFGFWLALRGQRRALEVRSRADPTSVTLQERVQGLFSRRR